MASSYLPFPHLHEPLRPPVKPRVGVPGSILVARHLDKLHKSGLTDGVEAAPELPCSLSVRSRWPGTGRALGCSAGASRSANWTIYFAPCRVGSSAVLVVRGEPGIGKSALVEWFVHSAHGVRTLRAVGVESEMELPFAGLHQLCFPLLDHLPSLPEPQQHALGTVFGIREGSPPDRFLVGLAALTLLCEVAEAGPLLCVIDDCHWLDRASTQALAFVARRLQADPVGLVFCAREPDEELSGLPELVVGGVEAADAMALLGSLPGAPMDRQVRERIVAEAHGNPLALLEWHRALTPAEPAAGVTLFGRPAARGATRGELPSPACATSSRDSEVRARRGSRAGRGTQRWCGGQPMTSWSVTRLRYQQSTPGWSTSVPPSGSVIRSSARPPTACRHRPNGSASIGRWPMPRILTQTLTAGPGIVHWRRRSRMKTSPTSSSAPPTELALAVDWRQGVHSSSGL